MASGRQIAETAASMSAADLSTLLSGLQQPRTDQVRLVTSAGSDNDRLWTMMAEKGWLRPVKPREIRLTTLRSFEIQNEFRDHLTAVALVCLEGRRQGMSGEEIIASVDGTVDPRFAHVFPNG